MTLYTMDVYDDAATLTAAQAASAKVMAVKHSLTQIFLETSEDLDPTEEQMVRGAVLNSLLQIKKDSGGGAPQ